MLSSFCSVPLSSLVSRLPLRLVIRSWRPWSVVSAPLVGLVRYAGHPIVGSNVKNSDPPVRRWYPTGVRVLVTVLIGYLYLQRGSERSATPMPGVKLQSPIRDLIPIDSSAGPSRDKGKGRAVDPMDEGKSKRERLVSLTVSEFEGAFHGGSSAFVYDWINDEHGDSSPEGPRESVDDWLTDQSYMDANEDPAA
jgi:hypothetical protein